MCVCGYADRETIRGLVPDEGSWPKDRARPSSKKNEANKQQMRRRYLIIRRREMIGSSSSRLLKSGAAF